jgi:photosystem II stability/assembly factor-like uncharacterized protein
MPTSVLRMTALLSVFATFGTAQAEWRAEGPDFAVITDLAMGPAAPDVLYAATSTGGVWRSDNGGATWMLPSAELTSRAITWIRVDPTNPNALFAGEKGSQTWHSGDRGATWGLLQTNLPSFHTIGQGIAFSNSTPAAMFIPASNLHYRSLDGGKTWADFRVPGQDAYCFAVDPKNAKTVYAGGRGSMLHFARSEDGGKTWRQVGRGLPTVSLSGLVIDPAQPSTIYAWGGDKAFKSQDRGDNWVQLEVGIGGTADAHRVVLHPSDSRTVWALTDEGLLRSQDGGKTWAAGDRGMGSYLTNALEYSPKNPAIVYAGTAGTGVFISTDGGSSWRSSNTGLAAAWVERLLAAPTGAGAVFAKLSVGFFRRDPSGSWSAVGEPFTDGNGEADIDGMVADRFNPGILWAFDTSDLFRSTDAGRSWQKLEKPEVSMRDMMKGKIDSVGFRSFVQDPANAKTSYAGLWASHDEGSAIWKTTDGGKKWVPAGSGVPNDDIVLLLSETAATVFALTDEKAIFRTTDGAKSWSKVASGLPDAGLRQLILDPSAPTRLFAATEKGLYRSTDNGATFARVSTGLEDEDIEAVVAAPGGNVYAGSFHGVWKSTDGGATWTNVSKGLPNTDVRALAVTGPPPLRLFAGTAGGSVYSSELP